MKDTNTLREEFKQEFAQGYKYSLNFNNDKIVDWWINKFNQKLEEIEFIIKDIQSFQSDGEIGTLCEQALQIIKNKKN